ncbi:MAG: thioredoxin domain-containing protein [Actinobacteria bacterium]|nr:thioredoxin domain-containing protein [Actinomycetota bacterium]
MSEEPEQQPDPSPEPEPTVIVGYPEVASAAAPDTSAGVVGLRRQVRTLRYLLVACLGLLIVLMIGLGVAVSGSRTQMDALSTQVTALSEQANAAAQVAPQAAPASPSAAGVEQLAMATELSGLDALPAGADATGAILIGDPGAANVVEVFIDYQCPFCQKWEATVGTALVDRALQPGSDLLIKQYNLAFLGETSAELTPAGASARAASAAACVLNHDGIDVFVPFSRTLFETADPSEPPGQFTAEVLVDLAKKGAVRVGRHEGRVHARGRGHADGRPERRDARQLLHRRARHPARCADQLIGCRMVPWPLTVSFSLPRPLSPLASS